MRPSKYETHIKPYFDLIEEMLKKGAKEKDIYNKLGVGKNCWYKNKREREDFRVLLDNKEDKTEELKQAIETLENVPTYEMWCEKIVKIGFSEDANIDTVLKAVRQLYPNMNHYLQLEYSKIQLEREKLELEKEKLNKGITHDRVVIVNDIDST